MSRVLSSLSSVRHRVLSTFVRLARKETDLSEKLGHLSMAMSLMSKEELEEMGVDRDGILLLASLGEDRVPDLKVAVDDAVSKLSNHFEVRT